MSSRWLGLVVSLLVLAACELVIESDQADDEATDAPADMTGESFVPPASCLSDCCDACSMVASCTGWQRDYDECESTCIQSVEIRGVECLARQIFGIDEEGCGSIVGTYERFDSSDTCEGPQD